MRIDQYFQPYYGRIAVRQVSPLSVRPGDLIMFDYPLPGTVATNPGKRLGLVLSSRRTSNGHFLSTQDNTLLNVLLMETVSAQMFDTMINILYKNRKYCNYWSPVILGVFFGKESLRTFDISNIYTLMSFDVKV
jgi:hypothetical protein